MIQQIATYCILVVIGKTKEIDAKNKARNTIQAKPCPINLNAPPPFYTKMAQNLYYKRIDRIRDIVVETTTLSEYLNYRCICQLARIK